MRANEILTEKIQLTPYTDDLNQALLAGVRRTISQIIKILVRFKKSINYENMDYVRDTFFSQQRVTEFLEGNWKQDIKEVFYKILHDRFYNKIPRPVNKQDIRTPEQRLQVLRDILENYQNDQGYERVSFGRMPDHLGAYCVDDRVLINEDFLTEVYKRIDGKLKSLSEYYKPEERFEKIQQFLNLDADSWFNTKTGIGYVLLHEMVHVIQHIEQWAVLRSKHEYRSYGTKDASEFLKSRDTPRFMNLYYSSPQEISAFAHNMAIEIIHSLRPADLMHVPLESGVVWKTIQNYINDGIPQPTNTTEIKVYRRYAKLVYQLVARHRQWLLQRAQELGDAEFRDMLSAAFTPDEIESIINDPRQERRLQLRKQWQG